MRADWYPEFGRHEQNREDLIDTSQSTRVDLTNVNSIKLQQLLEDHLSYVCFSGVFGRLGMGFQKKVLTHSVMGVFTCSDADIDGFEGFSNGSVSHGIIGSSRLFNEPRLQGFELLHVLYSLRHIPDLWIKRVRNLRMGMVFFFFFDLRRLTVGVDHQYTACGAGILVGDRGGIDRFSIFGHVGGIVNDGSDQSSSSKIIFRVGADFELKRLKKKID